MPNAQDQTQSNGAASSPEAGIGHNVVTDLTALKKAITNIEKKLGTLESMKGKYMSECKIVRDEIKGVYQTAKDKGINKRALRTIIDTRALQRKLERTVIELDEDILAEFEAYDDAVKQWELPL